MYRRYLKSLDKKSKSLIDLLFMYLWPLGLAVRIYQQKSYLTSSTLTLILFTSPW